MDKGRIRDALDSGRCMICHFMDKDESDLLIQWASAGENIHKGLRNGDSFCNHHFWRLSKVISDVALATLSGFFLEQFISELDNTGKEQTEVWFRNYREHQSGLLGQAVCPVCGRLAQRESDYTESVVEFLEGEGNMKTYEDSRGLCIAHFIKIFLYLRNDIVRERLRMSQRSHIITLIHELQEFIRKKNPSLRWERTTDEWIAYWRSLEKLVGRQGTKWQ